jgi:hypothetical protein
MTDIVKYFHSDMAGAPQMSNGQGQMISVLDACLKDGFNLLTPSSITQSAGVATATYGTAHGYEVDQVLLVSGCTQTSYNGEKIILSVPTSTTLTFAVVGTTASPATTTSSINTKAAPLGFAKIFSATNKAMYQSQNVATNQWIIRLDGTAWTNYAAGQGVEYSVNICRSATDIDTMIENVTANTAIFGQFRWLQKVNVYANIAVNASNIKWSLYGNDKTFFLAVAWQQNRPLDHSLYGFGELLSYKAGDSYNAFIMADNESSIGGMTARGDVTERGFKGEFNRQILQGNVSQSDIILAKSHTGIGLWTQGGFCTVGSPKNSTFVSGFDTGISAVNPQDFSILFNKTLVAEQQGYRGELGGLYSVANQLNDLTSSFDFNGQKYTQTTGGVTKTFRVCRLGYGSATAYVAFDISGTWA